MICRGEGSAEQQSATILGVKLCQHVPSELVKVRDRSSQYNGSQLTCAAAGVVAAAIATKAANSKAAACFICKQDRKAAEHRDNLQMTRPPEQPVSIR